MGKTKKDKAAYIKELITIDPPTTKKKLREKLKLIEEAYDEGLIKEGTYTRCKKQVKKLLKKRDSEKS